MHLSAFNTASSKSVTSSFLPSGRSLHTINTSDRKADVINPLAEKSVSPLTSTAIPTPTTPKHEFTGSQIFLHKSQKLLGLLNDTKNILGSYREINKEKWHIQYPFVKPQTLVGKQFFSKDDNVTKSFVGNKMKKALSYAETSNKFREQINTKLYASQPDMSTSQEINTTLNVLNLDLKKGDRSSAENVVGKLDKGSVATLLDERLIHSVKRIENLASRVADTSSKVLIAGDVNAGKSTFVNTLLRREIMPVDQQPCTTIFCEVRDVQENSDKEEVHAIRNIEKYNREDVSTYTAIGFENLFDIISSGTEEYTQLKAYKRNVQQSLLHNGIVDIALIDCPGLNRDTLKTTALFARQEEIDVIVFVVSAENHFTLSAKEFLSNASSEKAYIFIVVNRFDNIRNKEKCKRLVLDQIKEVSPRTYEHADDLVHFVTSTAIPNEGDDDLTSLSPIEKKRMEDFNHLEESLRTFILKKRSKSKLDPAQHYLDNLIIDIGVLAEFNRFIASVDVEKTSRELHDGEKAFEILCNDEKHVGEKAEKCIEDACDNIADFTKKKL
ncbi:11383_t:CDS:2, partial [Acaulospora morrowiae]